MLAPKRAPNSVGVGVNPKMEKEYISYLSAAKALYPGCGPLVVLHLYVPVLLHCHTVGHEPKSSFFWFWYTLEGQFLPDMPCLLIGVTEK